MKLVTLDWKYFECACYSPEHTLRFLVSDENLYAYVFLNPDPLHRRIWNAVKYVFGYQCAYGHFDEFILRPADADRLITLLNKYKENYVEPRTPEKG